MSSDVSESQLRRLCEELEVRLRAGERNVAEEYLSRPEINSDEEHALELIYRELTVLEELGQRPDADELVERFPRWKNGIRRLLEVHDAFSDQDTIVHGQADLFDPVGSMIGKYKVLQEIGEGGFGIVYMAEQHEPVRRKVALKIVKPGMDTRAAIARFEAERQALAMMEHENISRVLDAGATSSGRPYFVMDLVKGIPITEFCDKRKLSTVERLQLFKSVCGGVQHAHSRGIIHRDLKPSNVMITLHDGEPVPKIIDFGIAKALNQQLTDKTLFTGYGQMLGTPMYMSPEQAEMSGLDIDIRSDVYSLGVLLYELLTGSPPLSEEKLRTANYTDLVKMIMEDDPPTPSSRLQTLGDTIADVCLHRDTSLKRLSSLLRGDLDRIVMKALEKDRRRRYETVKDLASDVDRYLNHKPVFASSPGMLYRIGKFIRRNRALVFSTSAVLFALTLGFLLAVVGLLSAREQQSIAQAAELRERDQRERAENEEANAKLARDEERVQRERVETNLYYQQIARAQREWQSGELRNATLILGECSESKRGWEWHYLQRLCNSNEKTLRGHSSLVRRVEISPNGRWIASASGRWNDRRLGEVIIWNRETGEPMHLIGQQPGGIRDIGFSPDSRYLAAVNNSRGGINVWDVRTGSVIFSHAKRSFDGVQFSSDGLQIAAVGSDGRVHVYDAESGQSLRIFGDGSSRLFDVAFHPTSDLLAAVTHSGFVNVWDRNSGRLLYRLSNSGNRTIDFSPDGRLMATGGYSGDNAGKIQVYEVSAGIIRPIAEHTTNFGAVEFVRFSPDSQVLALTSVDAQVRFWDPRTGHQTHAFRAHNGMASAVAFGTDGRQLVTGGADHTVKVWTLSHADTDSVRRTHSAFAKGLAFSPDNQYLALAGGMNLSSPGRGHQTVQLWQLPDAGGGRLEAELGGFDQWMSSLAYSPNGTFIAAGGDRGGIRVWDASTKEKIVDFYAHGSAVNCLAYSSDGSTLVSGSADGTLRVWNSKTGKRIKQWTAHESEVNCVQQHPSLDMIASVGNDGMFHLWQTESGTPLQSETSAGEGKLTSVAFSSDGTLLATGGELGNVHLWRDSTQHNRSLGQAIVGVIPRYEHVHTFAAHKEKIVGLSFQSDGSRLASFGVDGTVVLWDTATTHEAIRLKPGGSNEHVLAVAFSHDGQRLAAARASKVTIWNAAPRAPRDRHSQADQRQTIAWHKQQVESCSQQGNWYGVVFHCNRLFADDPNNPQTLAIRGAALAAQGDWNRALLDCSRARQLGGNQISDQYCLALVQLQLGDVSAYRGTCRTVLASLLDPRSDSRYNIHLVARICALAPDSVPDLTPTIGFLSRGANRSTGYARHRYQNILGLILLRSGQYEDAIAHVSDGLEHATDQETPHDWLILASANHQLGRNEIARRWFEEAAWEMERIESETVKNPTDWKSKIEMQILRDEVSMALMSDQNSTSKSADAENADAEKVESERGNWMHLSELSRRRVGWHLNGLLEAERSRDYLAAIEHLNSLIDIRPRAGDYYIRRSRSHALMAAEGKGTTTVGLDHAAKENWERAKEDYRRWMDLHANQSSPPTSSSSETTIVPHVPMDTFESYSIESWMRGDWQQTLGVDEPVEVPSESAGS